MAQLSGNTSGKANIRINQTIKLNASKRGLVIVFRHFTLPYVHSTNSLIGMRFNKLNDWLRVIADLGILVGIVLVLVQMNQNEDLMRSQIMNQYYDSYSSYEASFAGENLPAIWEKSVLDPENLTLAEMRALEAVTFAPLFRWINLYRQSEAGVLGNMDWKEEVEMDAAWIFKSPYARAWWKYISEGLRKSGYLTEELYQTIETAINDPKSNGPREQFETIQEILKQSKAE